MPIPFLAYLAAHPAVGNLLTSGAAVFINGTNAFLGNQSREDAMRLNFQNSERQRAHQESTNKMQQEHQLKMFLLQQDFQKNERLEEHHRRIIAQRGHQENEYILKAHQQRLEKTGEPYYVPGTWVSTRIPHKPAPVILFGLNPKQEWNPFRNETPRIAPISRIKAKFTARNQAYEGTLFTAITTQEAFASETEVLDFYHRELNRPSVIIYGEFTGSSFTINALYAGLHDAQVKILPDESIDFGPRIINMWEISYNNLFLLKELHEKSTPERPGNKYLWLDTLELYTETFVGLHLQLLIDEYFYYNPFSSYEIQLPNFIKDKEAELTAVGKYNQFKAHIDTYYTKLIAQREKVRQALSEKEQNLLYAVTSKNYIQIPLGLKSHSELESFLKEKGVSPVKINNKNIQSRAETNQNVFAPFQYGIDSPGDVTLATGKIFHTNMSGDSCTFTRINDYVISNDPDFKLTYNGDYAPLYSYYVPEDIQFCANLVNKARQKRRELPRSNTPEELAVIRAEEVKAMNHLYATLDYYCGTKKDFFCVDRNGKILKIRNGEPEIITLDNLSNFSGAYAVGKVSPVDKRPIKENDYDYDYYYHFYSYGYGIINNKLEVVIPLIFNYLTNFDAGYCFASMDGINWYILNENREILVNL